MYVHIQTALMYLLKLTRGENKLVDIGLRFTKFDCMSIEKPLQYELPSQFADRLGQMYTKVVTYQHKKENGQFFTPNEIAQFMGSLSVMKKDHYKLLDPGCGTIILSSALIEHLAEHKPVKIELIVYETDQNILPYTTAVLEYLQEWLSKLNIDFISTLNTVDFVLSNKEFFAEPSGLFKPLSNGGYDIVISNPPYFKIQKDDPRALVAKSIVWGQPNIYSIFMMLGAKMLNDGGDLIFITPRSFASGNYFRAFREALFQEIQIEHLHLFGSRSDTFDRDNVLQELLILKGRKQKRSKTIENILVTHSLGLRDINQYSEKIYLENELIDLKSNEKIIHLPMNDTDDAIIKLFRSWTGSLNRYNINISTGPVVSFRSVEFLHENYHNGTIFLAPLYQLINTAKMQFEWPVSRRNKPQYIQLCEGTKQLMLPNKDYVFLRRFSSKDDKSRLVATPYFADSNSYEFIGVENHLNYIYRPGGYLENTEVMGIAALLNSSLFDMYFRTFNGNINVSATELREMPFPNLADIQSIGEQVFGEFDQERLDEIVNRHFEIEHIFADEQS